MFSANSAGSSDQAKIFNLLLLGTDTNKEHPEVRMPGYQAGELLNGIERRLVGADFVDKHILSGPETLGRDVDERVAEAIWIVLKAISEGKTIIKVAAHSRGGIEAILLSHALDKIMTVMKEANDVNFKQLMREIQLGYITNAFSKAHKQNGDDISFQSNQRQLEANGKTSVSTTNHTFKISHLSNAIKLGDLANKLHIELFLIDPVPGQSKLGIDNWVHNRFFTIPDKVKTARFIYMQDERTSNFEPVIPQHLPRNADIKFISLPGNHGTASGFLTEQDNRAQTAIIDDEAVESMVDEHGERVKVSMTDGIIMTDKIKRVDKKGKATRHVQKLVAAMLVEFFGEKSFLAPKPSDLVRDKSGELPPITKAINRRVKFFTRINDYKLNMYQKIHARREEYKKLRNACYINLPILPARFNRFHLNYRRVLTGVGRADYLPYTAAHPSLGGALESHVNDEHFQLHLLHENQMRLREEILREVREDVAKQVEISRKNFDALMASQLESLKQQELELEQKQGELNTGFAKLYSGRNINHTEKMQREREHVARVATFEFDATRVREQLRLQELAYQQQVRLLEDDREKFTAEQAANREQFAKANAELQAQAKQFAQRAQTLDMQIAMHRLQFEERARVHQAKVEALAAERALMLHELQNEIAQAQLQASAELAQRQIAFDAAEANLALQQTSLREQLNVLDARHDSIKSLDLQITCFERSLSQDSCEANAAFVGALKILRKDLNADIELQVMKAKKKIVNSTAAKIAGHTTDMLIKLQSPDADKLAVLREFESRCKQVPGWQKFARVICAVCIAGVGFLLGAVIGMSLGIVAGAWTGPGVFVAAAVGLAAGAAKGAAIGVTAGAACMGVASGFGSGALLFKPKGVRKQALNLASTQLKSPSPAA